MLESAYPTLPYPIRIKHSSVEYTATPSCATRLQAQCNLSGILHSTLGLKAHHSHSTGALCYHPDPSHAVAAVPTVSVSISVSVSPHSLADGLASLGQGTQPRNLPIMMPTNEHDTSKQEQTKPCPPPPFSRPSESRVQCDDWTRRQVVGHWSVATTTMDTCSSPACGETGATGDRY